MRSFLNATSPRTKYCVPFLICVLPNEPMSIMGKSQGTPFCPSPVPQAVPNTSAAVCWTVIPATPEGK